MGGARGRGVGGGGQVTRGWTQLATEKQDGALPTPPGLEESPLPERGLYFTKCKNWPRLNQ